MYLCIQCTCVHAHIYMRIHISTHKILALTIPGPITALPFRIHFTDYGFPMMEYKMLYLKGVSEDPNVCLYLAITLVIYSFLCGNFVCSIGSLITCIQKDLARNGVIRTGT